MEQKKRSWEDLTKDEIEVIDAVNVLKKHYPKETKIVENYMTRLVRMIEGD